MPEVRTVVLLPSGLLSTTKYSTSSCHEAVSAGPFLLCSMAYQICMITLINFLEEFPDCRAASPRFPLREKVKVT
jgi:hypothetical protein